MDESRVTVHSGENSRPLSRSVHDPVFRPIRVHASSRPCGRRLRHCIDPFHKHGGNGPLERLDGGRQPLMRRRKARFMGAIGTRLSHEIVRVSVSRATPNDARRRFAATGGHRS